MTTAVDCPRLQELVVIFALMSEYFSGILHGGLRLVHGGAGGQGGEGLGGAQGGSGGSLR